MEEFNPGYGGIGLIVSGSVYEVTQDGFIITGLVKRLNELKEKNSIVAVQRCVDIIPEVNDFDSEIITKLDDLSSKYNDFSTVNIDIGEEFLSEVLKRSKEILNYINRKDGNMLFEALKVLYKFFAKEDEVLQTKELCNLLEFLKLPDDVLVPYIEAVTADLIHSDPRDEKDFNFDQTLDMLEKYEIIQQFELNEYENESTFNCQFFLRILHEIGMIDMRKNNLHFNEDQFERSRVAQREEIDEEDNHDEVLIDTNVDIEEIPEYYITDVNDLSFPLTKEIKKVFCKGYTFEKERVLYND
mmetsp:Transcript_17987/g.15910  ORF Transcript_17987/g.15910 Transcript_17987/m.15910 type:complete len:300 (+) Transcript_17987:216-1115(+)